MIEFSARRPTRVAIIGVGNEMNGDDGAGVCAVRELAARTPAPPDVLLIDAGAAPESYTGPLRRFTPDLIIEIDAAMLDDEPGATAWLNWREADGLSASTHTLPPSVLAKFIKADLGCEVAIIGIQPERVEMGAGLSPAVTAAVKDLAGQIYRWLTADSGSGPGPDGAQSQESRAESPARQPAIGPCHSAMAARFLCRVSGSVQTQAAVPSASTSGTPSPPARPNPATK